MADPVKADDEQVQRLRQRLERRLSQFRDLAAARPPEQIDAFARPLLDLLADRRLGAEIIRSSRDEIKGIALEANMRACDRALRDALGYAKADLRLERVRAVQAARTYLRCADALGANKEFKRAAEMTLEAALLTGGIKQTGPTRAKLLDLAPRPPNRAKQLEVEEMTAA